MLPNARECRLCHPHPYSRERDCPVRPARKGVTAWGLEPMEENGDDFFVLTFHHGRGETTRLDLGAKDLADLAALLGYWSDAHNRDHS